MGPGGHGNVVELRDGPDPQQTLRAGEMLRVWEFGVGDCYRLPTRVNLQRQPDGKLRERSNVPAKVDVGR
jgi:hypothetical protein